MFAVLWVVRLCHTAAYRLCLSGVWRREGFTSSFDTGSDEADVSAESGKWPWDLEAFESH
jgi:hypothetical protein